MVLEFNRGLPTPVEIARKSGEEILRAAIDGELPRTPITGTMTFRGGDDLARGGAR